MVIALNEQRVAEVRIVYDYPPNYDVLKKVFNLEGHENVVFTYGDELYVPSGAKTKLDKPLLAHEEVHSRQQREIGIQWWWDRFLSEPTFRLSQELEAYREQYKAMSGMTAQKRWGYLTHIATDLSSEIYGNVITFEEAVKVITEGIKFKRPGVGTNLQRKIKKLARQNKKKGRR